MRAIEVHNLPGRVPTARLASATVVVTDVLRATTSMVWAFEAGVFEIIPALTVEAARTIASDRPNCLLAGERHCLPIKGFDFGNSPAALRDSIALRQRTLVMTTTNGTRALLHCQPARRVLAGAFSNLTALARTLGSESFHIVCAGTNGQVSDEDVLFAGALVLTAMRQNHDREPTVELNKSARDAVRLWQSTLGTGDGLLKALKCSLGGRNLVAVGRDDDIADAAMLDVSQLVPEFIPQAGVIRLMTLTKQ